MNLLEARIILELPPTWTPETLKKNYHRLAIKHHPDKNNTKDSSDEFIKINDAYNFLNRSGSGSSCSKPSVGTDRTDRTDTLSDLLKSFTTSFFNTYPVNSNAYPVNLNSCKVKSKIKTKLVKKNIKLSVFDFFNGTTTKINIEKNCQCEKKLCIDCCGCGYEISKITTELPLDVCMNCVGDGYIKSCDCNLKTILIKPMTKIIEFDNVKINIVIDNDKYFFDKDKVCYYFDISLKESLIGFDKIFTDYLGNIHKISIREIIKNLDGYLITSLNLLLVFNIIYPKTISEKICKQLKTLDF